jgi:hypothetical protein
MNEQKHTKEKPGVRNQTTGEMEDPRSPASPFASANKRTPRDPPFFFRPRARGGGGGGGGGGGRAHVVREELRGVGSAAVGGEATRDPLEEVFLFCVFHFVFSRGLPVRWSVLAFSRRGGRDVAARRSQSVREVPICVFSSTTGSSNLALRRASCVTWIYFA